MSLKIRSVSRLYWPALLFFVLLTWTGSLYTQDNSTDQDRINAIKAAFVLNIARFVTWPSDAMGEHRTAIHLCIYRNNTYGNALEGIRGQSIRQYRLEIRTIQHFTDQDDCEILLIPGTELEHFSNEVSGELDRPILTIADMTHSSDSGQARKGILVSLVRQGNRIGFEIDPSRVKAVSLYMSSELLKLARIVGEDNAR